MLARAPLDIAGSSQTELLSVVTADEPLGPSNADGLAEQPHASSLLFERQNTIYSRLANRPGILIGRRGAGKTAFLNHLRHSSRQKYIIFISAPDAFPEILRSLREIFGENPPFVEVVEKLWDVLIWSCIFGVILSKDTYADARVRTIRDYANRIGFAADSKPEEIVQKTIGFLLDRFRNTSEPIESKLHLHSALDFQHTSYTRAYETTRMILNELRGDDKLSPVLVLMDTLEDYRLERGEAIHAVSGLTRYLGHQTSNKGYAEVRFCLPAELYATFQEASRNPMKDFSSQTLLHWHAGDLLRIVAHRFFLYLQLHDRSRYHELSSRFDVDQREGAVALFEHILPHQIKNRSGSIEPTLAYILRHTQLLPRHLVEMFNFIFRAAIDPENGHIGVIQAEDVVRGVQSCEERICVGVAHAYRHLYPRLAEICKVAIPELPRRFTDGDLHTVFNRNVGQVKKRAAMQGDDFDMDYRSFKAMLVEVGAIGKQIDETEMYYEAEFEYNVPSSLVIASDDKLCLHPLFSGVYPKASLNGHRSKPVYPYGSDPR
jgi:hypothetical protein